MGWSQSGPHPVGASGPCDCLQSGVWAEGRQAQIYFGRKGEGRVLGLEAAALSLTLGRRAEARGGVRGTGRGACTSLLLEGLGRAAGQDPGWRPAPALGEVFPKCSRSLRLVALEGRHCEVTGCLPGWLLPTPVQLTRSPT